MAEVAMGGDLVVATKLRKWSKIVETKVWTKVLNNNICTMLSSIECFVVRIWDSKTDNFILQIWFCSTFFTWVKTQSEKEGAWTYRSLSEGVPKEVRRLTVNSIQLISLKWGNDRISKADFPDPELGSTMSIRHWTFASNSMPKRKILFQKD